MVLKPFKHSGRGGSRGVFEREFFRRQPVLESICGTESRKPPHPSHRRNQGAVELNLAQTRALPPRRCQVGCPRRILPTPGARRPVPLFSALGSRPPERGTAHKRGASRSLRQHARRARSQALTSAHARHRRRRHNNTSARSHLGSPLTTATSSSAEPPAPSLSLRSTS